MYTVLLFDQQIQTFMNLSEPGSSPGPASRESTPGLNSKAKKQKTASDESDESESKFL